eukprot:g7885.t1
MNYVHSNRVDREIAAYPSCMDDVKFRKQHFPQLYNNKKSNICMAYLDHAGATLPSTQQLEEYFQHIRMNIYGNPHSSGPAAGPTSVKIDAVRHHILNFCNVDSSTHSVIFTAGATHALKIVGEYFPWMVNDTYCHSIECHTSLLGIREYALDKGSNEDNFSIVDVENKYNECIEKTNVSNKKTLFAFPAECNFSGFQPKMDFLKHTNNKQHINGANIVNDDDNRATEKQKIFVLLDAAKFAATSPLDLSELKAVDFVAISFYKIFGFPTGLGALIVKNKAAHILGKCKKYFGGGTVSVVMATTATTNNTNKFLSLNANKNNFGYRHKLKDNISERFEDGTLNFQGILSVSYGLKHIISLGGMENISRHVKHLTSTCFKAMSNLVHSKTKQPLCQFYGYYYDRLHGSVGSIITFNLLDSRGQPIGYSHAEKLASLDNIQLRTGCFCNPGACQKLLNILPEEVDYNYRTIKKVCGDDNDLVDVRDDSGQINPKRKATKKPIGAIRISFGYMSNMSDVLHFINFLRSNFLIDNFTSNDNEKEQRMLKERSSGLDKKDTMRSIDKLEINCVERDIKAHIKRMYVYPIKSCGGFAIPLSMEWPVVSNKLFLDRQWAIITPKASLDGKLSWRVVHCKRDIAIAKVRIEVVLEDKASGKKIPLPLPLTTKDDIGSRKVHLRLNAPGMKTLYCQLPIESPDIGSDSSSRLSEIMVCGEKCRGVVPVEPSKSLQLINKWISDYFGFACRLINADYLRERKRKNIGWSNSGQVLLINTNSVLDFQNRLRESVHLNSSDMHLLERRFRPNIVVASVKNESPYEEDTWEGYLQAGKAIDHTKASINAGTIELERPSFFIHGACTRCRMININPETGLENNEYLRILSKYRGKRSSAYFGILLGVKNGLEPVTYLKCGDELFT